jgi:septum formation inhibitor-activating ATPase MinD
MGSIITITGKHGSGKSTVLSNLACALSKKELLIGCISTDLTYSSLPYFFGTELPLGNSLGKLLASDNPASGFVECGQCRNIFLSGIAAKENCFAHTPPSIPEIEAFLERIKSAFDFVLIEAGAPIMNVFSAVAINKANELVHITPCTVQGSVYDSACFGLLNSYNPSVKPITVINFAGYVLELKSFMDKLSRTASIFLPANRFVLESECEGVPIYLSNESNRGIRQYRSEIDHLCRRLTEGGDDDELRI